MNPSLSRHRRVSRVFAAAASTSLCMLALSGLASADQHEHVLRAAAPEGAIEHILVIDMENENYATTFGAFSPAVYLNSTLLKQGQLIPNYFATSHVSLGNYISQVSGQGTNPSLNNDCLNLATLSHPPLVGGFTDIPPGLDAVDQAKYPGQVVGDGCVFPAPTRTARGAQTIGDQLDRLAAEEKREAHGHQHHADLAWRAYAEDMGEDMSRDYGVADPLGGADCAQPPVGGVDNSNSAAANDQYSTGRNPFG